MPGFHGGAPVVQTLPSAVDTPTVAAAKSLTYVASDSYPGTPGTTIQRLDTSGSPDPAWSGDGVLTLAKVPQLVALHPNSDGTLLVGGLDASGEPSSAGCARTAPGTRRSAGTARSCCPWTASRACGR